MKNLYSTLLFILLASGLFAQARPAFKYQGVARDASNQLISNGEIALQVSLLNSSSSIEYIENHTLVTTNQFGVFSINIGDGDIDGASPNDEVLDIDWSNQQMFIQVGMDIDLSNGIAYQLVGTSELLTVPYAIHSFSTEEGGFDRQVLTGGTLVGSVLILGIENGNTMSIDLTPLKDGIGTDDQELTFNQSNNELSIEGGNTVDLSSLEGTSGSDDQNITDATLMGTLLSIGIEDGNGAIVDLAPLQDGTGSDDQTLNFDQASKELSIEGGNAVDLSTLAGTGGTDDQDITGATLSGTQLSIEIEDGAGATVDLAGLQDGTGTDNQNISRATLAGTQLSIDIEDGNGATVDLSPLQDGTGTDDQQLSFNTASKELSIEGGNIVDLSALGGAGGTDNQELSVNTSTYELEIEDGNSVSLNDINHWTRLGTGNLIRDGRVLIGGGSGNAWIDPSYFAIGLDGGSPRYRLHKDLGLLMRHDGDIRASFKYDELKMVSANGNSEVLMNGTFLQNKSNSLGTTAAIFPGSFSTNGLMSIYSPAGGNNPRIDMYPDSILLSSGGQERMKIHHDKGITLNAETSGGSCAKHDHSSSIFEFSHSSGVDFQSFSSSISNVLTGTARATLDRTITSNRAGSTAYISDGRNLRAYMGFSGIQFQDTNGGTTTVTMDIDPEEGELTVYSGSERSNRLARAYGLVAFDGSTSSSLYTDNYTVVKEGTGEYGITISDWPSGELPCVNVSIYGTIPSFISSRTFGTNGYFKVYTSDKDGIRKDRAFNFQVFGK